MPRDPRYDVLFESVDIGPVRARNRFYQVPHCSGMGYRHPRAEARMRGIKAEGGWAVISTQECSIHWSGDYEPSPDALLWDDRDIPALALMAEAVHEHDALAAIELTHNGPMANNLYSRLPPLAPSHTPVDDPEAERRRQEELAAARLRQMEQQPLSFKTMKETDGRIHGLVAAGHARDGRAAH